MDYLIVFPGHRRTDFVLIACLQELGYCSAKSKVLRNWPIEATTRLGRVPTFHLASCSCTRDLNTKLVLIGHSFVSHLRGALPKTELCGVIQVS